MSGTKTQSRLFHSRPVAVTAAVVVLLAISGVCLAQTTSWLDNGTVRIGVDLTRGGAIHWFGPSGGSNQINISDEGRYCQQSYYSGPWPFGNPHPAYPNWGWNPVQAGDVYGKKGTTLEHSNDGTTIYTKSIPKQWALNDVDGDCTFEQWTTLVGSEARVRARINMGRSDTNYYGPVDQELPALYTIGTLSRLYTYTGSAPFTGGPLTEIVNSGPPWAYWDATESWAAHVNANNWGVGVYTPGSLWFVGGFYGTKGSGGPTSSQTGYISPLGFEFLEHDRVYEHNYVLILGNLTDIRNRVYELQPNRIYATADTYTAESTPSIPRNNDGILVKQQIGNHRYGWIEFQFGNHPVQSARLTMYQCQIPSHWGTWHRLALRAAEYDLNESLTWNTQPDTSDWTYLHGWYTRINKLRWYSTDITDFYNANLGKGITFQMYVTTGSQFDCGARYEDRENSRGTGNVPHIAITAIDDDTPPSVPTYVQAAALSWNSIDLTWTASTDNVGVAGYRIYRDGGAEPVGTSSTPSYTDTGLQPETIYSYTVSAYDAAGNESDQSSPPAVATTLTRYAVADFDQDGDVDLEDFGLLQRCYGASPVSGDCVAADLNDDGVVDQTDFEIFRACLSGAGVPADPACGPPG